MCAVGAAVAEVRLRAAFFKQTFLSPLTFNLGGFPPLLLISGTRDFYYSDRCDLLRIPLHHRLQLPCISRDFLFTNSPRLHERACKFGVDVTSLNVVGAFHDFIEYSEG
jgi:acetyl esterase/lipase